MVTEQRLEQQWERQAEQQRWLRERADVYRRAYSARVGRCPGPQDQAQAPVNGVRAMLDFEWDYPPERIGFNKAVTTDPAELELVAPPESRWKRVPL